MLASPPMRYLRGHTVRVWYRYPSEPVPRELSVRVLDPHSSIGDAVSRAIARDRGWPDVLDDPQPTLRLLDRLDGAPDPDAFHALSYASIRPPTFCASRPPPRVKRSADAMDDDASMPVRKRCRD